MPGISADGYRQFARQCLRWATESKTDEEKRAFLDLARDWTSAASFVDKSANDEALFIAIGA
jgi:hypothetical protein